MTTYSPYRVGGHATIEAEGVRKLVVIVEAVDAADEVFWVRDEDGQNYYAAPDPDFYSLEPVEPEYAI